MIQRAEWYPASVGAEVWTVPIGYTITKDLVRNYAGDIITMEHLGTTLECEVYKMTPDARLDGTDKMLDFLCNAIERFFECTHTDEPARAIASAHREFCKTLESLQYSGQNGSSGFGFQQN